MASRIDQVVSQKQMYDLDIMRTHVFEDNFHPGRNTGQSWRNETIRTPGTS